MNVCLGSILLCLATLLFVLLYIHIFRIEDETIDTSQSSLFESIDLSSGPEDILVNSEILETHPSSETTHHNAATEKLIKILHSPSKLAQFEFDQCRMADCFDYSRCSSEGPIRVHIVPKSSEHSLSETGESNIIHDNIIDIVRKSKYHEPDPNKACIFLLEDDTLDRDPLSKSFKTDLPNLLSAEYQYGMNHLVFNLYSGSWPDYRTNDFAGFNIGAAILAKASNSYSNHRPEFDISLPLFSHLHPKDDSDETPSRNVSSNRPYLLTFKGKRYVHGLDGDTRNSLYHLSNGRDVILLTTCRHGKKWRDAIDERCSQDDATYDNYDFADLMMQSKFCLTPRGRRLGSFRYLEAMSYGCVPVVLSDGWVKPFGEIIDWSKVVIQLDEDMILLVPDILRDISDYSIKVMQKNIRAIYRQYFSTLERIITTTLSIIEKRVKNHNTRVDS